MQKQINIPLGMVTRKFYCHRCGEELSKVKNQRVIERSDREYPVKTRRTEWAGDLELTEYDFHCHGCNRTVSYREQCAIGQIQKRTGSHILPERVLSNEIFEAEETLERNKKWRKFIIAAIGLAVYLLYYIFEKG